ncbi:MAG: M15 family metallopeptidase [Defluviitaleaceae bacterium]|nr:M15 family metallopeptidase [Defluviitaleaceae bacterium]
MRRQRYPRYREPAISKKFTFLLVLLAIAAAGFAIYIVWFTYPGVASIDVPPVDYEENGYDESHYNEHIAEDSYPPENTSQEDYQSGNEIEEENDAPVNNDEAEESSQNEPHGEDVQEDYFPENVYIPEDRYIPFGLLTTVDNTLLPWYLKLVNRYNFLEYDFEPQLSSVGWGHYFDSRAYRALLDMLDSARAEGLSPIVASSFRSVSRQTTLFNNRIQRFVDIGYEWEDAFEAARRIVAYPGTSEHNLGLAVDIVALSYQNLTANQAYTPEGMWLAQNSYRYGFVMRYPYDKQHITNIIFEPWHFRYVGVYAATEMFYRGLVLEEYVSELLGSS